MINFIEEKNIDDMRKLLIKSNRVINVFKNVIKAIIEKIRYSLYEIIFGVKKTEEAPPKYKSRYRLVSSDDVNIDINNWYKYIHNFKQTT